MSHAPLITKPPASARKAGTVQLLKVTPAMAARWLEPTRNPRNRSIRKRKVDFFVHLMETGQFVQTGEPLQFSGSIEKGNEILDNGQHRLTGVVKTGKTIEFVVVDGLDPNVILDMDTGARRTFGDFLVIQGVKDARALASAVRLGYELDTYGSASLTGGGTREIPHREQLAWYELHQAELQLVAPSAKALRKTFGCSEAAMTVAILFILRDSEVADWPEVYEFVQSLLEGGGLLGYVSGSLHGHMLLRSWLTKNCKSTPSDGKPRPAMQAGTFIEAWNLTRKGDTRTAKSFGWVPIKGFPVAL